MNVIEIKFFKFLKTIPILQIVQRTLNQIETEVMNVINFFTILRKQGHWLFQLICNEKLMKLDQFFFGKTNNQIFFGFQLKYIRLRSYRKIS